MKKNTINPIISKELEEKAIRLHSRPAVPTLVSISDILVPDDSFYREVKPRVLKKMCDEFSPSSFHPLLVGKRSDGNLYLINGNYRLTAAKKLGFDKVLCHIIDSDGVAFEAKTAVEANTVGITLFYKDAR